MLSLHHTQEYINTTKEILTFLGSLGGLGYIINLFLLWRNRRRLIVEYVEIHPFYSSIELTNIGDKDLSLKQQIDVSSLDPEGRDQKTQYFIRERGMRKILAHATINISVKRVKEPTETWPIDSHWYLKIIICPTATLSTKKVFYRHTQTREQISRWRFYVERWLFKRLKFCRDYISDRERKKHRLARILYAES